VHLRSIQALAGATVLAFAALATHAGAGEAPEGLAATIDSLRADLARRHGVPASDVRMVSVAAVVWRDTSMGCGKPNESRAQTDVEGYEVVLEHAGQRFDYRVRKDGTFVLCE
jgi:hypothetical protein